MFRNLSDDQREDLYFAIIDDPRTPQEFVGDNIWSREFEHYVTTPSTSPDWVNLNVFVADFTVGNSVSFERAAKLYYIFHEKLEALGAIPGPPSPLPTSGWLRETNPMLGVDEEVQAVAGFGPLAATFWVSPPTAAEAPVPDDPDEENETGLFFTQTTPAAPVQALPTVIPSLNVPEAAKNAIVDEDIEEGDAMVNFHRSRNYGRYFKASTYNRLGVPKRNPFTQAPIAPTNLTHYRAHLVPVPTPGQGGGKKKRRLTKRIRRNRKRKSGKSRKQ